MIKTRVPLGATGLSISPIAMGCWPIAGITSLDVSTQASRDTILKALECGINHFDTAFCYGYEGESERLIGEIARTRRSEMVIATKGGVHWKQPGERVQDASPAVLLQECQQSLSRLGVDAIDLYYLHAPDPNVQLQASAEALKTMLDRGWVRAIGVSNVSVEQLRAIQEICPVTAVQPPYNMLQREIESNLLPYCIDQNIAVLVYWPLMKGLLAGKLPRDHQFQPGDGRAKYPMFQGLEWERNQDFLDELRLIAADEGKTVAQVVLNWTLLQSGITSCLCGAKRPYQIEESAGAMGWELQPVSLDRIAAALQRRGKALTRPAL